MPIIKGSNVWRIEYWSRRKKLLVFNRSGSFEVWDYARNKRDLLCFNSHVIMFRVLNQNQTRVLGYSYNRRVYNLIWRRLSGVTKQNVFGSSTHEPVHVHLSGLANHHRILYSASGLVSYNPISQKRKQKMNHSKEQYWVEPNFVVLGKDFLGLLDNRKIFVVGAIELQKVCEIQIENFMDRMLFAQKQSQLIYFQQKTIHCVDWRVVSHCLKLGKLCQTRDSNSVSFRELIRADNTCLVKQSRFARARKCQSKTLQLTTGASSLKRVSKATEPLDGLGSQGSGTRMLVRSVQCEAKSCGDSKPDSVNAVSDKLLVLGKLSADPKVANSLGEIPKFSRLLRVKCNQRLKDSNYADDDWDCVAGTHFKLDQLVRFQRLQRAFAVYSQTAECNRSTLEILKRRATRLNRLADKVRQQQLDNYRLADELLNLQMKVQQTNTSPDSHSGNEIVNDSDIFVED